MNPRHIRALAISALCCCAGTAAQSSVPVMQWIQAEDFSARQGGYFSDTTYGDPAVCVRDLGNGNWLRFDSIDFLSGQYDSLALFYWWDWTNAGATAAVRFRIDSPTVIPIASITRFNGGQTYGYTVSDSVKISMTAVSGVHALYVTVEGSATWLNIDKIRMTGKTAVPAGIPPVYYVATDGNDADDGLSVEKAFRTIQRAASVMLPGSVCNIRQGVYRETVRPAFTGTAAAPLTFQAYDGERAVISGGDPVTGWTVHSGSIYKAPLRYQLGFTRDQVLVDGTMAWMARAPNVDENYHPEQALFWSMGVYDMGLYRQLADPVCFPAMAPFDNLGNYWPCNPRCDRPGGTPFGFTIKNDWPVTNPLPASLLGRPVDFFKGGLATIHNSFVEGGVITGSTLTGTTQTAITGVSNSTMMRNGSGPGCISHLISLLDAPNEWFWKDSTLYLWSPDGGNPANHLVEAKRRMLGMDLRSKSFVNVRGLRFFATSLSMEDANNCVIDNCYFKYISHFDTVMNVYDLGPFSYLPSWNAADGHSGIFMGGHDNTISHSTISGAAGAGIVMDGKNSRVTNCIVRDCNYAGTSQGGIQTWSRYYRDPNEGVGLLIDHNTIKYNSWANVQVNYLQKPKTIEERLRIRYNDFGANGYYANEKGCISGQTSFNVEIDHNWFHGTAGGDMQDIHMETDFGATGWIAHHNVFWQGTYAAGDAPANKWGILKASPWAFSIWDSASMVFNNTSIDSVNKNTRDREYLWAPQEWAGFDTNNILADGIVAPWKFTDPAKHDYTLQAGSPAIDKGVVVPGYVTTFNGAAPDLGAYEYGQQRWAPGVDWQEQPWQYPPASLGAIHGPGDSEAMERCRPSLRLTGNALRIIAQPGLPYQVRIFDARGALACVRHVPRGGSTALGLGAFVPGMYMAQVSSATARSSWRFCAPRARL